MTELSDARDDRAHLLQRIKELESERERLARGEEMEQAAARTGRAAKGPLAGMAHDLRTPLSRIMGFTEVIREGMAGPVTNEQKEYLGYVYESAQQLLALINAMLDLFPVRTGRAELERRDLNVTQLLADSVSLFKEKAAKHGIDTSVDVAGNVPVLRADERKLKQVMFELLANAFRYTGDGGSVSVTARMSGNFVQFMVRDTGIGIDEERQVSLFRQPAPVDRSTAGPGHGLPLCREYVELHGGSISVESRPGEGSAFSFTVPVISAAAPPAPGSEEEREHENSCRG